MTTWAWDERAARYRDTETGRFLSRERALELVNESIGASENRTEALSELVGAEQPLMSPADWRDAMRREIKDQYVTQYILGRGGRDRMTQADWGSIGGMLADQYRFLDDFTDAIAAGDLSEAQIRARSKMYVNSAREAHERASLRAHVEADYDEVRWVIDPGAEHCVECEAFAALGWQKIADNPFNGAIPGDGSTICLTNCRCHLEYRRSGDNG